MLAVSEQFLMLFLREKNLCDQLTPRGVYVVESVSDENPLIHFWKG